MARKTTTKTGAADGKLAQQVLRLLEAQQTRMLGSLRVLVEMESPSSDKMSVDILGAHLEVEFERLGGDVTVHRQSFFGDHLQIQFKGGAGKPMMLLGHFDTVWDLGTLKTMPFKIDRQRAWGSGVYDMKAGIVSMMYALAALREADGVRLARAAPVWLVTD